MKRFNIRNHIIITAITLLATLLCCAVGCSRKTAGDVRGTPSASPAPRVEIAATPSPSPVPAVYYVETFKDNFADELDLRFSSSGYDFDEPFVPEIEANVGYFMDLVEQVKSAIETAAEKSFGKAFGANKNGAVLNLNIDMPSWKYIAALYAAYGPDSSSALIESAVVVDGAYSDSTLTASIEFSHLYDVDDGGDAEQQFSAHNIYAYLATVYDDNCELKEYSMPELPQGYLESLCFPLEKMYFYDSWYGPRQHNTRHHLGMDIRSREYADIYSCCDGVIKSIGSNDTAGNYVVVEDERGYRYHYYHMVVLTDFLNVGDEVKKGDLIGYVGNTGNSDRDHLHLSILNDDLVHFNPYIIMCDLKNLKHNG